MNHNTLPRIGARYRVTSELSWEDTNGKKPTVIGSVVAVNNARRFAVLKIEYSAGCYTECFTFAELTGKEVR